MSAWRRRKMARDPCRLHATASRACLLRSLIKLLSSSSSGRTPLPRLGGGGDPWTEELRERGLVQAAAGQVHLGTRGLCRLHATASRACLL